MIKISRWAGKHRWAARILITLFYLVMILLGINTGQQLQQLGILIPTTLLILVVLLFAAGFLRYPQNRPAPPVRMKAIYFQKKYCDMLMTGGIFLLTIMAGNHPGIFKTGLPFNPAGASLSVKPKNKSSNAYQSIKDFERSIRDENGQLLKWKERKKLLREQVRGIRHSKEPSNAAKAALIVLSVLVALGLLAGVAVLACSISCSGGSGFLTGLVLVGGTAAVIFLLVLVIRRILGSRKKREFATNKLD